MSAPADVCDVAICGGGLVGASLALALRGLGLGVQLIEPFAIDSAVQPSFDERTTALGNGSRRIFETLGVWGAMAGHAAAIRDIHISDAGRFGFARLEAGEFGLEALGYVVPNRIIGRTLWQALVASGEVHARVPARVTAARFGADTAQLTIDGPDGTQVLAARLVVAADGALSVLREAAGIAAEVTDYAQTAIVTSLRTDLPPDGIAYERFTPAGPMALLPLQAPWRALVWAVAPDDAAELLALEPAEFLSRWQQAFGYRGGRARALGARGTYPLSLTRAERVTAARCVLLGNASQALHPVAGQGFNLALRDAAVLAEILAAAVPRRLTDPRADPGAATLLDRFAAARSADRSTMLGFTDGLVRLFASRRTGVAPLRDAGLLLFDLLPPAKRALSRISFGFGSATPRLARGLTLR
jgi:2-octaprenyl-6-methoxyphenol hydroxylase